jgi:hypothetical protein
MTHEETSLEVFLHVLERVRWVGVLLLVCVILLLAGVYQCLFPQSTWASLIQWFPVETPVVRPPVARPPVARPAARQPVARPPVARPPVARPLVARPLVRPYVQTHVI